MQATTVRLSEDQAEKVSQMVKMLLLNPDMLTTATADPQAVMKSAGLSDDDIVGVIDYLEDMAQHLRMEAFPWSG
jgi:hypothetical protein